MLFGSLRPLPGGGAARAAERHRMCKTLTAYLLYLWRAGCHTFLQPPYCSPLKNLACHSQSIVAPDQLWYNSAVDYANKEGSINLGSLLAVQFLLFHWVELRRWAVRCLP